MNRLVTLPVVTFDVLHEQNRNFFVTALLHLHFNGGIGLTHSAAPLQDRGAPHATRDRALLAARASAPSLPPLWFRQNPCRRANARGNRALAKTIRCW